jgi:hypothetical protein
VTILQHLSATVAKLKKEIAGPMPLDAAGRARRVERTRLFAQLTEAKTKLIATGLSANRV